MGLLDFFKKEKFYYEIIRGRETKINYETLDKIDESISGYIDNMWVISRVWGSGDKNRDKVLTEEYQRYTRYSKQRRFYNYIDDDGNSDITYDYADETNNMLVHLFLNLGYKISHVWDSDGYLDDDLTEYYRKKTAYINSDEDEDEDEDDFGFECTHMMKTKIKKDPDMQILNEYKIKYIYHMTHYKNVENILANGLLSHNNTFVNEHIDNENVNERRNKQEPIFNRNIQDYVPFYFNPKNPMLYVNHEHQDDIVIFAFSRDLLLEEQTLFTDGNAAVKNTKFFNNLDNLDELNWECIQSRYWHEFEDGKREVMAEVLVHGKVGIEHLEKIFCYDEATKNFILEIDDDIDVEIKTSLYF